MKLRCRCCLTTSSNIFYNIFDEYKSGTTCADVISILAATDISQDDGLSQKICSGCKEEIRNIYEFLLKVRHADETLRKDLENAKIQEHEGNMHLLERDYFIPEDDGGMEVCVDEEILEHENEHDVFIVEEIHEEEETHVIEEIPVSAKEQEVEAFNQKDNLLQDLALIAASQENVNIGGSQKTTYDSMPEDENDEDYLIEYSQDEKNSSKAQKWKCGECKVILRGDVSYEGHMNLHKQTRPHACQLCPAKYRCRAALKRHKDQKHSVTQNLHNTEQKLLCLFCQKQFFTEINFYLHQSVTHNQSDRCPFDCEEVKEENLKQHLEDNHFKDIISAAEVAPSGTNTKSAYQCFTCSENFPNHDLFMEHVKSCQTMIEDRLFDYDDVRNENVVEIVQLEESEISETCEVCRKIIFKRNLKKHMEMHKRKDDQEGNVVENTKQYLCAFCPREFKSSKSLNQHEKLNHPENSDIVYVCTDCDRQYASQYQLETHRKLAHKERDNICNICGNAFKLRNQLTNHMKLHLEKNIPCPHCDKKYARQFDLNVHIRSHTGEQPYACHLCEKRFAIKVRLTYHLQKHYGIKHCCKECGAQFNSKQKLKAHSFKHTGMPYRCQMCDYHGFATRNTFKRHLTRVHHTSISEEALNEMFKKNTGKSVNIKQIDDQPLVVTVSDEDNQEEVKVMGK